MATPSRIVLLLLVATTACLAAESERGGISLQAFLDLAEDEGIVSTPQAEQLRELAARVGGMEGGGQEEREVSEPAKKSVFMRMYNHLTLLNVLYFSGALLIMGAYTLFMSLAFESCASGGLSAIMLVQVVLLGVGGILLWIISPDFQFVGGL